MAQSRFARERFGTRPGVSILEVLFAIMITSIGLMGAIAIFPAAMMQARRGAQADATAVAGITNVHAFDAQGMRQPAKWLYYNGSAFAQVADPDGTMAYCIDPRFVAANLNDSKAHKFPYDSSSSLMGRVTLSNGIGTTNYMGKLLADLNFQIDDDISYDRFRDGVVVRDNTLQAASIFVRDGSSNALKRQSEGHMSWMATLAPKLERMPTGGVLEDRYVLSIVVFYDRPGDLTADSTGDRLATEWALKINSGDFHDAGINGGSVTLTENSTSLTADERARRLNIHAGQWVMLRAKTRGTASGTNRDMPLCRWYRVMDADEPDTSANTVEVTLAGSDWETSQTDPANEAEVIVCQGVVAVYEKTIKLEPKE
ncbi:hypothetical protein ETAA8_64000 [Anatilimnocola aggregata]|uniref:Uncharacterized protein n=1 Tax=Anatilimnocola aggregata TaxID=2528021 RepID=A0A517YLZ5_9BACT|nr:hypothetical protein [Anatilimnocola aggregata]QDU31247.1 hypothetical protein ETAA8_64000 [Anatilimnocola aggregata]